jgi:hypothetical protein
MTDFYSTTKKVDLYGFPLNLHFVDDLDELERGKLLVSFTAEFGPIWTLFIQPAMSNDLRGKYHMFVIHGTNEGYAPNVTLNEYNRPDLNQIPREEYESMRKFVAGFIHGVRSFRKKRYRAHPTTRRY